MRLHVLVPPGQRRVVRPHAVGISIVPPRVGDELARHSEWVTRDPTILTIDVEEYFQVVNLEGLITARGLDRVPSRLEVGLARLRICSARAERAPPASFSAASRRAIRPRSAAWRRRAARSRRTASTIAASRSSVPKASIATWRAPKKRSARPAASACCGYRAPHFSIDRRTLWAFDVLVARGYRYDSSVFASFHPDYGLPDGPARPFAVVVPTDAPSPSCRSRWPDSAGGARRRRSVCCVIPYRLTRAALRRLERRSAPPFTIYLHPWELDADQPRVALPAWRRWRQYHGLGTTEGKVARLLADFRFTDATTALDECALEEVALEPDPHAAAAGESWPMDEETGAASRAAEPTVADSFAPERRRSVGG